MKKLIVSILLFALFTIFGSVTAFAHGGEEEQFDARLFVEQSIIALDQRQPNIGVVMGKLDEVLGNKTEVKGVDIEKVSKAEELVNKGKYGEAMDQLFLAIGEDREGSELGSPLLENKKGFSGKTSNYLLLTSAILFILIGGYWLNKQKRGDPSEY